MDGDTRGRGSRVLDGLGRPPRRLLVLGGGAAALALLVDGGLRLDVPRRPAPPPTRRPAADEQLLLAAVADLERLVSAEGEVLSARSDDALVRRLRSVSREQLRVLRGRLTNAGVPTSVIEAATARPTTSAPVRTRSALASLLATPAPDQWEALTTATAGTRELLAAAYAERLAAAALLGHPVETLETPSPARPAVVARTQPLVYAFEVVAAQSTGSQRRRAEDTLVALNRLELAVSGAASSTPAGWALPFPVTTPAEARRLASTVLRSAVDGTTAAAGDPPAAASIEDVARWSADVQAIAVEWDVPLTAFPGATA